MQLLRVSYAGILWGSIIQRNYWDSEVILTPGECFQKIWMTDIIPNIYLIGVQKSATTSVYDWMAQHPDICGPVSMKDTPFFIDDKLFNKGMSFITKVYKPQYRDQPIVLNGSANIIYFEKAIRRVRDLNPNARMILILRHPTDRAISAYNFAVKRNMESESLQKAIELEPQRLKEGDLEVLSNNTYVDHGYYYEQISRLYEYFDPSQILILLFKDVREQPEASIRKIYEFIGVDPEFTPSYNTLNKTGTVRYKWIKNLIYNNTGLKKFLIKYVVDPLVPYDWKYRTKIFFLNLVTSEKKSPKENQVPSTLRQQLLELFVQDIEQLEKLIHRDLSDWRK